jgi:hypothetical protein
MITEDGAILQEPSPHSCGQLFTHSDNTSQLETTRKDSLFLSHLPQAALRPVRNGAATQVMNSLQQYPISRPAQNNFSASHIVQAPFSYFPPEIVAQKHLTSHAGAMVPAPASQHCDRLNFGECECVDEPCFCHPFTAMCAGATKSGKTEWAKKFVLNACYLMHPPPDEIIWCYSEYQPSYEELRRNPQVRLVEGLPDIDYLKSTPYRLKLLVMDDLLMEGDRKKSGVTQLFTKGAHHWNCSCIHIVQNLFYGNIRTARINSHYLILMRNPSDKLQVCQLARQLFPTKQNDFLEAYSDATKEPYGYLVVDLAPNTNEKLRLRSHVFPSEFQCVYMLD